MERLIIAVIKLMIVIASSIFFLLSVLFPLGNYIIAYSKEYVNTYNKKG